MRALPRHVRRIEPGLPADRRRHRRRRCASAAAVARLTDPSFPGRTTLMKLPTLSTLWDYINRAMPWSAPKSLVARRGVCGGGLHAAIWAACCPMTSCLSDAQHRRGAGAPAQSQRHDAGARAVAGCRRRAPTCKPRRACAIAPARRASRRRFPTTRAMRTAIWPSRTAAVGAQRGVDTSRAAAAGAATAAVGAAARRRGRWPASTAAPPATASKAQLVGPAFREVGRKHAGRGDAVAYLNDKIRSGGSRRVGQRADAAAEPARVRCAGAGALDRAGRGA